MSGHRDSLSDSTSSRNFRMLYYDQLGLRAGEQRKELDVLLNENPLVESKLSMFAQRFILPIKLRPFIWKVLLGILPVHRESMEFVTKHRRGQYEDLKQTLLTLRFITPDHECDEKTQSAKTIVLMYLMENGMLSVLNRNTLKRDGHKVFVLEAICQVICEIIHDECDAFWISKYLFKKQENFVEIFVKLPTYVKYYLQLEDKRLHEHLCDIQLLKVLPYDRWLQTYFRSVFVESLDHFEKIVDKLVAGSCHILAFVFVALLLTFSIKLKEVKSSEKALKLISKISCDVGVKVIDKTMELWDQHRSSLSEFLGCD